MNAYVVSIVVLLIYMAAAWSAGTWLHLQGTRLWALRAILALIGFAGAGFFLWYYRKVAQAGGLRSSGSIDPDLRALFNEANHKLKNSQFAKGRSLSELPVLFVLGDSNSAKTTSILQSGLEPALLAGHIYNDDQIAPTQNVNIWYAQQKVLIDCGGVLLAQPERWRQVMRFAGARITSAFSRSPNAPRAAVVCFDCETFAQPGSAEKIAAAARNLNARLRETSQILGISFPVYVLFTKMDRLPGFSDYVRNLTSEEAAQLLGASLPRRMGTGGVYGEEESRRLARGFDELLFSLAERRLDFLARESVTEKLAAVYEFPRELRKIRSLIVQFLTDLGRPSQLGEDPFLRGFYFTGVRPVTVNDIATAAVSAAAASAPGGGATKMFSMADVLGPSAAAAARPQVSSRKVPQWTFLPHLFTDVVLRDRNALAASSASSRVSGIRRILLASAITVVIIAAVLITISFFKNRALQEDLLAAAAFPPSTPQDRLADQAELARLEQLRAQVQLLQTYQRDGAPFWYRFGLYSGGSLLPSAEEAYFQEFRRLLLSPVLATLVTEMKALPASSSPTDDYAFSYSGLKGYLITTTNHDKSTVEFLAPVLLARWRGNAEVESPRVDLAGKQFEFYASYLTGRNPFTPDNDTVAVERARTFLNSFQGTERIYQAMIAEAGRGSASVQFNRQYPGSAEVLVNNAEVPAGFTKQGFQNMQAVLKNPERFFGGEEWVLGNRTAANIDVAALRRQIAERYQADYVNRWRGFVRASSVVRYLGLKDAAAKLSLTAGNRSPLLQMFGVASTNTAVENESITRAFAAIRAIVPPGSGEQLIAGGNQPYMGGLLALQTNIAGATAAEPLTPEAIAALRQSVSAARMTVGQVAQSFPIDPEGRMDVTARKLLEDPITSVEPLIRDPGPGQLNGAGAAFCAGYNQLADKYPFNANAAQEASLAEITAVFQPGSGTLWQFYEQSLKNVLVRQGRIFVPNPAAAIKVSPRFLAFMNVAAGVSDAFFSGGMGVVSYTVKQPSTSPGLATWNLTVDGQSISAPGERKQFNWRAGMGNGVKLSGTYATGGAISFPADAYQGPWGAFRFFGDATWQSAGDQHQLEWPLQSSFSNRRTSTPAVVRYDLEMAAPVFNKTYLANARCVSPAARAAR